MVVETTVGHEIRWLNYTQRELVYFTLWLGDFVCIRVPRAERGLRDLLGLGGESAESAETQRLCRDLTTALGASRTRQRLCGSTASSAHPP